MSIKIYCFTGTGNSLSIARQLAQPMRAEVVRLDLSYYGEQASETCVSEGDIIGFVFPDNEAHRQINPVFMRVCGISNPS